MIIQQNEIGKQLETTPEDEFYVPEGELNLYCGQIGTGKTYGATADIIEELKQGRLVYATWPIHLSSFDDRKSFFMILKNLLFLENKFYKINCEKNFHFIDAEKGEVDGIQTWNPNRPSEYIEYLNSLNHCTLYIDEAWRVIDSYQKTNFSLESRNLILVTRHKYRTVNLIAQRPTSIQVTARANMNRFYVFYKVSTWPWVRFERREYQDMVGENVNLDIDPISVKRYWGKKEIFNAYNSYFYGDLNALHKVDFEVWHLDIKDKVLAFVRLFRREKKLQNEISTEKSLAKTPF